MKYRYYITWVCDLSQYDMEAKAFTSQPPYFQFGTCLIDLERPLDTEESIRLAYEQVRLKMSNLNGWFTLLNWKRLD